MLVIPESVWERLLDGFAQTAAAVERVAFLDGVRIGETGVVTTITFPDAQLHAQYYDVPADAMSRAGRHLREHRLARLAQVHTHGGLDCRHSARDDEHAYTQREGAVSVVLPNHAAGRPLPHDGLIHVRAEDGWIVLDDEHAAHAVRLVPSHLDHRTPTWSDSQIATKAPSAGYWRRLTRIMRRR